MKKIQKNNCFANALCNKIQTILLSISKIKYFQQAINVIIKMNLTVQNILEMLYLCNKKYTAYFEKKKIILAASNTFLWG